MIACLVLLLSFGQQLHRLGLFIQAISPRSRADLLTRARYVLIYFCRSRLVSPAAAFLEAPPLRLLYPLHIAIAAAVAAAALTKI